MRLDDVVKRLRPKGSEVRLTVKKVDGRIEIISIIRNVVRLKKPTLNLVSLIKWIEIRVIYLPKFYIDFENKDGRDAGKDIALEVERLKSRL
jgi:carboxyl-terminal processing protease